MRSIKPIVALLFLCTTVTLWADPLSLTGEAYPVLGPSRSWGPLDAYVNPAALALHSRFQTMVGFAFYKPWLKAPFIEAGSLGNLPGYQGEEVSAINGQVTDSIHHALDVSPIYGFVVGQVLSLQRLFPGLKRGISLGVLLFIPGGGSTLVSLEGKDPYSPQFPYFGGNDQHLVAMVSAGVEVIRHVLFVGAGAVVLANLQGSTYSSTPIAVFDPKNPDNPPPPDPSTATFSQELGVRIAPVLSVMVRPAKWVDVGIAYQGELALDLRFTATARVMIDLGTPMDATIPYHLKAGFFYLPARLSIATSLHPINGLDITLGVSAAFTRSYKDHLPITTFEIDRSALGKDGELKGLKEFGYLRAMGSASPRVFTRNTLIPGIEVRYSLGCHTLSALYTYTPSPLSVDQQYQNMLLSSSLHQLSLGWRVGFRLGRGIDGQLGLWAGLGLFNRRYNKIGSRDLARGIVQTSGYGLYGGSNFTVAY